MSQRYQKKEVVLRHILQQMGKVVVAYSGGVDSTLLLTVARDTLRHQVLAVTAHSPIFPQRETREARAIAHRLKVKHHFITTHQLARPHFTRNTPHRCYLCKKELFTQLKRFARRRGYPHVIEASTRDDEKDFRPGMRALKELGIRSPLREAGFSKKEVRAFSEALGLPTAHKPSMACLASRFPYGHPIELRKLQMVEQAEDYLYGLKFAQCRVRHHGSIARIEVAPEDIPRISDEKVRKAVARQMRKLGFTYCTLDLEGYRSGSLNEVLPSQVRQWGRTLIMCDFDGTINTVDSGHALLKEFATARWKLLNEQLNKGIIGSRELYQRIAPLLKGTRKAMEHFIITHARIDPYFTRFLTFSEQQGWEVKIVSDGFDFYIDALLTHCRIQGKETFANRTRFTSAQGVSFSFPYHNKRCGRCGNCKRQILRRMRKTYDTIVYVGDGISDRCATQEADVVFAKKALRRYCGSKGIAYVPYRTFKDIQHWLSTQ